MLHVAVLALLLQTVDSWVIESTHSRVHLNVTRNVKVTCLYDGSDNGQPTMTKVLDIEIGKVTGRDQEFELYASVRSGSGDKSPELRHVDPGVTATGDATQGNGSFLSVTWTTASSSTLGTYACKIAGLAADRTVSHVLTGSVSIDEVTVNLQYVLNLLLDSEKELQREIDLLKSGITSGVDSRIRQNFYERRNWPGGRWALLRPLAGCPQSTTVEWTYGFLYSPAYDQPPKTPNSVDRPVYDKFGLDNNNYLYVPTCKRGANVQGPAWPKGDYCIHRVGGSCPPQFKTGGVKMEVPSNSGRVGYYQSPDMKRDGTVLTLFFCCRYDGEVDAPMTLPVETPFYLYRVMGACQPVHNANVTEEIVTVGIPHNVTKDAYVGEAHPDSSLNPGLFHLCYYKPLV